MNTYVISRGHDHIEIHLGDVLKRRAGYNFKNYNTSALNVIDSIPIMLKEAFSFVKCPAKLPAPSNTPCSTEHHRRLHGL